MADGRAARAPIYVGFLDVLLRKKGKIHDAIFGGQPVRAATEQQHRR